MQGTFFKVQHIKMLNLEQSYFQEIELQKFKRQKIPENIFGGGIKISFFKVGFLFFFHFLTVTLEAHLGENNSLV